MPNNLQKSEWAYGAVPLARNETHDKVFAMVEREPRGKVLDAPTGTGVLAGRLKKIGFEVSCCDIDASYFSVPDLKMELGNLNHSLPYASGAFDYVVCLDGIEHTENPSNAIREFQRVLKRGGKLFLSTPNYLNIERRLYFLLTGCFSKIPSHTVIRDLCKGEISMAHISPMTYPLLKFIMEWHGFRIVGLEKDRSKPRMVLLLPAVWGIRLFARFLSKKKKEDYHVQETLPDEIIMGGNTLIIRAEKVSEPRR